MTLRQYLEQRKISSLEFARLAGISRSQVNRLLSGGYTPTLESALAIERATKGKVKCEIWLERAA